MASRKKKGDDYELAVLNEIDRLLESGLLPFPKDFVTVRHKHKYKTDAGNLIEVDISLEITRPGASTYTQLVLIECKDYKSAISTMRYNDLAKKNRVSARTQGIFIHHFVVSKGGNSTRVIGSYWLG